MPQVERVWWLNVIGDFRRHNAHGIECGPKTVTHSNSIGQRCFGTGGKISREQDVSDWNCHCHRNREDRGGHPLTLGELLLLSECYVGQIYRRAIYTSITFYSDYLTNRSTMILLTRDGSAKLNLALLIRDCDLAETTYGEQASAL